MSGIVLRLFGPPHAGTADVPHVSLAAKAFGLLAYLALEPGAHTRERLAALLWGESDEDDARASLRQALKHLRDAVGDAIVADRHTIALTGPVSSDVADFLAAAASRSRAATEFEVGRFFEGMSFRGAPEYEEWLEQTRQRLVHRFHEVLREEARGAVSRSRWRDALTLADRWLAADAFSEEAVGVAMEAQYCLQGRARALARFRHYRDFLKREIGSRPGEALFDLARRIELANGAPEPERDSDLQAPVTFQSDLVGREPQWLSLTAAWHGLAEGRCQVRLIEGESGMGKTRLAEEFIRWATSRGATVLRGQGYELGGGAPFGPLATALRGALAAPGLAGTDPEWLSEASRLLPELHRRFPNLPPTAAPSAPGERWRLFEGVAQVFLAIASERSTILFIDDLQWCDVESIALLNFLLPRLENAPVLFIATATTGELQQNPAAQQLAQSLSSRRRSQVVSATPLAEDEVWQLVRQMGNVRTPGGARRFAARLHEVSEGNPFQVIEIVKLLFAEGLLAVTPVSREWVVPADVSAVGFGRMEMPRSVRDAIGKRITRLPYELRDLLATLSVAGRPVQTDVLGHVHGMSRLRVAALTDALVERHLVDEQDGSYRMAHRLLGDVMCSELTLARRAELHRALSLALEAAGRPERLAERAGEIAWHAERAGETARAYEFALLASDQAAQRFGYTEASAWLGLALRAEPERRAELERRARELADRAGWAEVPVLVPGDDAPMGISEKDFDLRVVEAG